jgi:hypothetical protein
MGSGTSERVGVCGWGASGLMLSLSQVGRASVDGTAVRAERAGLWRTRLARLRLGMTRAARAGPGGGPALGPVVGQLPAASLQTVSVMTAVTWYGSMLALGRRSSSQPLLALATAHGMRMEAPRSEVP